jgi:hypothetical protein
MEDNKITIIEGPPPVFEPAQDGWALGLGEGPHLGFTAITHLRTYNGSALVERCYRAWHNKSPIHLHFRNDMGLEEHAPIFAVRSVETPEGQMLLLWVNLDREKVQFGLDSSDDEDAKDSGKN